MLPWRGDVTEAIEQQASDGVVILGFRQRGAEGLVEVIDGRRMKAIVDLRHTIR